MPGLIDAQIDTTKPKKTPDDPTEVETFTATGYDPAKRTVDENQTVAGQVTNLLKKDSPYLEQARAGASERANERGLINSSIAVGAGESAAISAALPIASADAATYGQAAAQNVEAENVANQFGAASSNAANQFKAASVNQQQQAKLTGKLQQEQTKLEGEIQTGLQQLRGTQARDLANIEANYKQLMQANSSAAAIFNEAQQQIATILRDPNTSAEQKAAAVNAVNKLLESGLAVVGGVANVDLGGLLDFEGIRAASSPFQSGGVPSGSTGTTNLAEGEFPLSGPFVDVLKDKFS